MIKYYAYRCGQKPPKSCEFDLYYSERRWGDLFAAESQYICRYVGSYRVYNTCWSGAYQRLTSYRAAQSSTRPGPPPPLTVIRPPRLPLHAANPNPRPRPWCAARANYYYTVLSLLLRVAAHTFRRHHSPVRPRVDYLRSPSSAHEFSHISNSLIFSIFSYNLYIYVYKSHCTPLYYSTLVLHALSFFHRRVCEFSGHRSHARLNHDASRTRVYTYMYV